MAFLKAQLTALPSYFGGKRRHLSWIFNHLAQAIPREEWRKLVFLDAFMGGGSVSMAAKALGFRQVLSNDCSLRSQLIAEALLCNTRVTIESADLLWLNRELPKTEAPGLMETEYCPSVLSRRQARQVDRWLYWARQVRDNTKRALLLILIWHTVVDFVCFPTSFGASNRPYAEAEDGLRSWDSLNPKRYVDGCIPRLLQPSIETLRKKHLVINRGIFGGAPVQYARLDALAFLQGNSGDLLFADPPYAGTLRYETSYAVLDHLLSGEKQTMPSSPFSADTEALHTLLDAAQHIPTWVLTYGNKTIDLDGLTALVRQHAGDSRLVQGFAKQYKHLAHVSKNDNNQELLVIASSKKEVISYAH